MDFVNTLMAEPLGDLRTGEYIWCMGWAQIFEDHRTSCGRQNNGLLKISTSCSLEPMKLPTYVTWQNRIQVADGIEVTDRVTLK